MSVTTGRAVVDGTIERGYEAVRDAFAGNFTGRGEAGAACAVYVDGRKVVDLWGGVADHVTGRPWTEDTVNVIWSATKGAVAALVHRLAQQGRIDLDRPVADYWPEFARNGKQDITVRMVLSMRAGLPVIEAPLTFDDLLAGTPVVDALEGQSPIWRPGSAHGYHAFSYGYLLGEIVRRVTGRSVGRAFAEEVAKPLGLDFWIGLPAELEARVARLIDVDPDDRAQLAVMPEAFRVPGEEFARAFADPRRSPTAGCGRPGADGRTPTSTRAGRTRPSWPSVAGSATPARWPGSTRPAWARWTGRA
jgi:CubicO group peptidase (beta-lactamase class C family)